MTLPVYLYHDCPRLTAYVVNAVGGVPVDRDELCGDMEALACPRDAPETDTKVDRTTLIDRIAAALDIPPNAFMQLDHSHSGKPRILAENAEALKIFAAITNPDARQRSLAYLRWIADQSRPR